MSDNKWFLAPPTIAVVWTNVRVCASCATGLALLVGLMMPACGDTVDVGANGADGGQSGGAAATGGTDAGGGAAGGTGGVAGGNSGPIACQGHIYQCGDGVDNDGDGLIDAADPDCLGPCDNTEDSYYGGIPGQNNAPCRQDCYFDQDTGPGNDDCYWSQKCDPLSVAPGYPPSGDAQCAYDPAATIPGSGKSCADLESQQSQMCGDVCGKLTPNGCDCFGCCELPAGSGKYVWLGSTENGVGSCDAANVADPQKCKPCTPVPSCLNPCDTCELCVGKSTLPAVCAPDGGAAGAGGSGAQCAPGVQPCGQPGQSACPASYYCITGCCRQVPS